MTTTEKTALLTATEDANGWSVTDNFGGCWRPSDEAATEIEASANPAGTALLICHSAPMRGKWSQ